MSGPTVLALLDFGGPRGAPELVPFLSELLADVLPGPSWLRVPAAAGLARLRSRSVQPQYERIGWSPLVDTHLAQAEGLRDRLGADLPIVSGMMFTPPRMADAAREIARLGASAVIALPMFPHYSYATTHAAFGFFHEALERQGLTELPVRWIGGWYDDPGYIAALAASIRDGIDATPGEGPLHLVFSPHGLPVSYIRRGDPYADHVRATVRAVLAKLGWDGPAHIGWQSRVGPATWLTPSTPQVLDRLGADGVRRVCVVPVSFVSEHIETLYEIDVEYRRHAEGAGIVHFGRAPALGARPDFLDALAGIARRASASIDASHCLRCQRQRTVAEPERPHCPNCGFRPPLAVLASRPGGGR